MLKDIDCLVAGGNSNFNRGKGRSSEGGKRREEEVKRAGGRGDREVRKKILTYDCVTFTC